MKKPRKKNHFLPALTLLLPGLLLGPQAGCATRPPAASSPHPLQGTWQGVMVGHEKDGKITVTITGNSLHFHRDTNFWWKTTFTLPPGDGPKRLHATIQDCPQNSKDSIGQIVSAIYKIEDQTLTLAGIRTPDGEPEPPVDFDSENTMAARYELRKVQPQ